MNNMDMKPMVKRETKNKIRVDFERTSLKERLKSKFLSTYFLKNTVWYIFRLMLLIGIAFVVIQPFITMILQSLKGPADYRDTTVVNVPRTLSLGIYKAIFVDGAYIATFFKTLALSLGMALLQMASCCLVGYGLAKFKFRGSKIIFFCVILTMVIPHGTLQSAIYYQFRYFDILGVLKFFSGGASVGVAWIDNILSHIRILPFPQGLNLVETVVPLILMSMCGLALKNGLYVFMLRQFFRGVPDELEESAYLDGANTFRTFLQVILPISVPMMITVFLFAFCWQWTDDFYIPLFFATKRPALMTYITYTIPLPSIAAKYPSEANSAMVYACGLMACSPLAVLYLFCQKYLVQGIERSGIVG